MAERYAFGTSLEARLRDHLASFERRAISDPTLRRAAVAIVVVPNEKTGDACVLLTKRPAHLRRHANQFALPGGRLDEGENEIEAALRETREELRLDLAPSTVVGLLDDYPTRSGFRITPVVACFRPPGPIDPDPEEVARVFHIPLGELDSPDVPQLESHTAGEAPVLSAPLPTVGHSIYSPTAALLYQFREVALRGQTTRVAHYDQPRFAWQ
jgi:8-oxo-dGTP pyrophosphatase MutT (NUDIX family)